MLTLAISSAKKATDQYRRLFGPPFALTGDVCRSLIGVRGGVTHGPVGDRMNRPSPSF
jgi:hypothetical protein